ncbi:class I lanthipeptide [Flavobacterium sp. Fl-318]|jgi:bacteriocin-like protein|uniref:Class I lanthipeptide n=1 Tax=Flavobacterium cupriresistens TaxID=2893885 RepID=A0ABU4RHT4_9FLAO|nr:MULTISPECIES: class I lanthipeptide [unclassified Flavobacterium]MDX6192126.1 class I lanthipeptide [Flavobacterium sp. Fl-318]UFH43739.1 class I lanthipeptide [Flavobacterium sp. F-323]
MKKQNPTNKLAFNKVAVAELNENQLTNVNGGTSTTNGSITLTGLILPPDVQNV